MRALMKKRKMKQTTATPASLNQLKNKKRLWIRK